MINPTGLPVKVFRMDRIGVHVEIATESNVPEVAARPHSNGVTSRTDAPEAFDVPLPEPGNWDPPSED